MTILETERLLFRNHIATDLEPYCEYNPIPSNALEKVHPSTGSECRLPAKPFRAKPKTSRTIGDALERASVLECGGQ